MKFFAVFTAVIAVAVAYPAVSTWTLNELSAAIQSPDTDPAILPYLENALNEMVSNIFAGNDQQAISVSLPTESIWTFEQLIAAVHDSQTNPALLPYLEDALHDLMVAMNNENHEDSIAVEIPAMAVNLWTMQQLSSAIQNPETDPELLVYLEYALNEMMTSLFSGNPMESIAVITPPGVVAAAPAPVVPTPVIVSPQPVVPPTPVKPPVNPAPAVVPEVAAEAPSSPLVQIIVNVNSQSAADAGAVTPVPVEKPVLPVITEPVSPAPVAIFPLPETTGPVGPTPVAIFPLPDSTGPIAPAPVGIFPLPDYTGPIAPAPVAIFPLPDYTGPISPAPVAIFPLPESTGPIAPAPVAVFPIST